MTVITIATVGYREMGELSRAGMWFTIGLILFGVAAVGFAVSSLTAMIVGGEMRDVFKGRKMESAIAKLQDHYIICGSGVVGREVALELGKAGRRFVVVERNLEASELRSEPGVLFVEGDATDDETLRAAGIDRARGLISALREDASNVFVTLTARQLNPRLLIVSRASEPGTESKLLRAGADRVVSPYQIGGRRMASVALRPSVVNFLDVVTAHGSASLRVEEVAVGAGSPLIGSRVREADIGQRTGAIVLGIQGEAGLCHLSSPGASLASAVIRAGDILIALGDESQVNLLKELAGG
jgi:voltage-gated potassium channel